MNKIELYCGDCLEIMPSIPNESIDFILCDLPYGTSVVHKWNKALPLDKLWKEYERVIKPNGVICLFGTQPFISQLICSKIELFRYQWLWKKETPTGFLNANYKPLNAIEYIAVFSKATVGSLSKNPIPYHPPTLKAIGKKKKNSKNNSWREAMGYQSKNNQLNTETEYVQKFTNYPTTILEFARVKNQIHPTQKPSELLEFLIKTYTDENDIVLDNCMGSGSTGEACTKSNRRFIGIEKEQKYYDLAVKRLNLLNFQKNVELKR